MENYLKSFAQQFGSHKLLQVAIDPEAHTGFSFFCCEVRALLTSSI